MSKTNDYNSASDNDQLPDRESDRQSDLAVMDQEEYKNKRRLERLLDAHDRVEEWDNQSMKAFVNKNIQPTGRDILILRAVKQFIRESYNLLRHHHQKHQTQNASEQPDGYWVTEKPICKIEREHDHDIEFYGLRDILDAEMIYTETWEEMKEARHGPNQYTTCHQSTSVPQKASMKAFTLVKKFLDEERDLDLSFKEESGDAGFDYGPLLESPENPEMMADGKGEKTQ